jgi:hypothetical protein
MKTLSLSTLSAAVAAAFVLIAAAPAQAQVSPPIIQHGENATMPDNTVSLPSTTSRAAVRAEASRVAAIGGDGAAERALFADFQGSKTRVQVVAELRAAQRLGLLPQRGDAEPVLATAEQAEQIRQAGLAATQDRMAQVRGN